MSLALLACRYGVALAGAVVLASSAGAAENKPTPLMSQPSAYALRQPTHMRTTVTLPNGLTIGCVVSLPPEPAVTVQVTTNRYVPPPDPVSPCLTPEQREAHEKANATLQRL